MTPFRGKLKIRHLEIVLAVAEFGSPTLGCLIMFSGWPLGDTVSAYHAAQPGVALNAEIDMLSLRFGSGSLADGYLWLLPENIAHIRQGRRAMRVLQKHTQNRHAPGAGFLT